MSQKIDYERIMLDRKLFNETVYTSLSEAVRLLKERQKDKKLKEKIEFLLRGNIPAPLGLGEDCAVQFRQVATPNYDTRWFLELTKDNNLKPVFFEYHEDKFTSNNDFKHSLGQLRVHEFLNKNGDNIEEKFTVTDFNKYNGKKFKEVMTLWGEPLIDFHKRLFEVCGYNKDEFCFYNASDWFKQNGLKAVDYYENFLLLFSCHGILFENFLLDGEEGRFTKEIFLPAFEKAYEVSGVKPLIVPIPPMDNQIDTHWVSYGHKTGSFVKKILHD